MKLFTLALVAIAFASISCERHEFSETKKLHQQHGHSDHGHAAEGHANEHDSHGHDDEHKKKGH